MGDLVQGVSRGFEQFVINLEGVTWDTENMDGRRRILGRMDLSARVGDSMGEGAEW